MYPDDIEMRKKCPQAPPGFNNIIRLALGKEPLAEADDLPLPSLKSPEE